MDFLAPIILTLFTVYVAAMIAMLVMQRKLIYHPSAHLGLPSSYGFVKAKQEHVNTADGETITLWVAPPTTREETILYLHGNTGNIGNRSHKLIAFNNAGYGVLAVSYRGFGGSTGAPSEAGLIEDGRAALKSLNVPHNKVIIYGESLGSGVAVQLATEYEVKLVVLEAPFTSIRNRSRELYPWLPTDLVLKDKFDSLKRIGEIKSPLLIIHGEEDEVMPVHHARRLFAAAPEPKKLVTYPFVAHTDFGMQQILEPLAEMENQLRR